jgi:hypothetical protein
VVIKTISLDPQTLQSPIALNIFATSTEAALKTESSFASKPNIFSGFTLRSLSEGGSPDSNHPVTASITFTLNLTELKNG